MINFVKNKLSTTVEKVMNKQFTVKKKRLVVSG